MSAARLNLSPLYGSGNLVAMPACHGFAAHSRDVSRTGRFPFHQSAPDLWGWIVNPVGDEAIEGPRQPHTCCSILRWDRNAA